MRPIVDGNRLWRRVEALAALTDPERPYTRRSFSDLYLRGRDWLRREFTQGGLDTAIDAAGNLVGRLEGLEPGLPPLVIGSHSDTVVGGGRFDGVAGVLSALEVAQALREADRRLRHPLEVIDLLAEEPSEYGLSCIGSRALAGELPAEALALTAPDGTTLAQGIARVGGDPSQLSRPLRGHGSVAAFLELHIEQGRVLETLGADVGIVTDIVGIVRMRMVLTGQADHAGTTPMDLRHDALLGAAEIILHANELARTWGREATYLTATVGRLALEPNSCNVVPGRVEMLLEVRSSADEEAFRFLAAAGQCAAQAAQRQGLELASSLLSHSAPASCSDLVQGVIRRACERLHLKCHALVSGAGHDARYMTRLGPTGMLFVPCRAGRSHCPQEWVEKGQLAAGAGALLAALQIYDEEKETLHEHLG